MSRSYGIAVFAVVGWIGLVLTADAQQTVGPTFESKPVTTTQGPDSSGNDNGSNQKQRDQPQILIPALEKIERAIHDLIPKPNEAKNQRDEDREVSDLKAQKGMAVWAERMTWAAWASVAVTLVGLTLLWRTLYHTSQASQHTKGMLDETKIATKATVQLAYLERQVRLPRLYLKSVKHVTQGMVKLEIGNAGESVAAVYEVGFDTLAATHLPETPKYEHFISQAVLIEGKGVHTFELRSNPLSFTRGDVDAFVAAGKLMWGYGYFRYTNMHNEKWITGFGGHWPMTVGALGHTREFRHTRDYRYSCQREEKPEGNDAI